MNEFGKMIKRMREEAGLSQSKFAEEMGVSKNSVQNWECGNTKVDPARFSDFSYYFNVPIQDIIMEYCKTYDSRRENNWPYFLFDEYTNSVIDTFHLNLNQQELFGLLCIQGSEYIDKNVISYNTFDDDLKKVPFEFINSFLYNSKCR